MCDIIFNISDALFHFTDLEHVFPLNIVQALNPDFYHNHPYVDSGIPLTYYRLESKQDRLIQYFKESRKAYDSGKVALKNAFGEAAVKALSDVANEIDQFFDFWISQVHKNLSFCASRGRNIIVSSGHLSTCFAKLIAFGFSNHIASQDIYTLSSPASLLQVMSRLGDCSQVLVIGRIFDSSLSQRFPQVRLVREEDVVALCVDSSLQ